MLISLGFSMIYVWPLQWLYTALQTDKWYQYLCFVHTAKTISGCFLATLWQLLFYTVLIKKNLANLSRITKCYICSAYLKKNVSTMCYSFFFGIYIFFKSNKLTILIQKNIWYVCFQANTIFFVLDLLDTFLCCFMPYSTTQSIKNPNVVKVRGEGDWYDRDQRFNGFV